MCECQIFVPHACTHCSLFLVGEWFHVARGALCKGKLALASPAAVRSWTSRSIDSVKLIADRCHAVWRGLTRFNRCESYTRNKHCIIPVTVSPTRRVRGVPKSASRNSWTCPVLLVCRLKLRVDGFMLFPNVRPESITRSCNWAANALRIDELKIGMSEMRHPSHERNSSKKRHIWTTYTNGQTPVCERICNCRSNELGKESRQCCKIHWKCLDSTCLFNFARDWKS